MYNVRALSSLPKLFDAGCCFLLEEIINNGFMGEISDRDISNLLHGCFSNHFLRFDIDNTKALEGIRSVIGRAYQFGESNEYIDLFNQAFSLAPVLARSELWVVSALEEIDKLFAIGDLAGVVESIQKLKEQGMLVPGTEVSELFSQFDDIANTEFEMAIKYLAENVELFLVP